MYTNKNVLTISEIIEQINYENLESSIERPLIYNCCKTIEALQNNNTSIARFGDGEISIINKKDIPFQKYNKELANRLKEILKTEEKDFYTGINYEYFYADLSNFNETTKYFYENSVPKYRKELKKYLNYGKQYYSANFTQIYQMYNLYNFEDHFKILQKIWQDKKILVVTCKNAIQNLKYNIYDNARLRIFICPE